MINTRIKLFILKLGFCFFPFVLITQYAVDSVARKHTNVSFKSPLVLDIIPNEIKAPSRESIFVTGRPGAGCFVFLIRDPANQSKIAYDSWGTGGPVSEAFNFQPNRKYTFKLHLPALAGNSLNDKNGLARLIIELDGRVLIDKEVHYFKYSNNDVYVGYNPIGGSVCGDQFAGSIKMNNEFLWYVSPSHSSLVDRFCNYLSHQYGLVFFFFKALGVIVSLFSLALLASH